MTKVDGRPSRCPRSEIRRMTFTAVHCANEVDEDVEYDAECHDDDDFTRLLAVGIRTVLVDETNDGSTRRWRTPDLDEDVGYE